MQIYMTTSFDDCVKLNASRPAPEKYTDEV